MSSSDDPIGEGDSNRGDLHAADEARAIAGGKPSDSYEEYEKAQNIPPDTRKLFAFRHKAGELPTSYVRGDKVEAVGEKLVVSFEGKPVQRFKAAAWELVETPDMPERAT